MPRRRQPPHLNFRADEGVWVIHDGEKRIRTGCSLDSRQGAEIALSDYIARKFTPAVRESALDRITVAEVLLAYLREHAPKTADPARISWAVTALATWWGDKSLMDVRMSTCEAYIAHRTTTPRANMQNATTEARRTRTVSTGTVRRELGVLSAAINYFHAAHGPLTSVPAVTFPSKPAGKPHWLTRGEFARLLLGAMGWYEVTWSDLRTGAIGRSWKRDRLAINRHLCRFLIIGRYTATRPGAILKLRWMPSTTGGWPDLDAEILHRKGLGREESNKRQPMTRLGRAAIAHFRRWERIDAQLRDDLARSTGKPVTAYLNVVSWGGGEIRDIGRAFSKALELAHLPAEYTPHILRHMRVTWWVQAGLRLEEVAEAAGMSRDMVETTYWHHSPLFQKRAAEA
jgi:integrase